ncbi:hypothetical protein LTR04_005959 [Oleoguttula sp. CCFEE 6159]|nr:hypothetical protein LTR04_005959 [Oleoguttula sp. CCFEE 6159]
MPPRRKRTTRLEFEGNVDSDKESTSGSEASSTSAGSDESYRPFKRPGEKAPARYSLKQHRTRSRNDMAIPRSGAPRPSASSIVQPWLAQGSRNQRATSGPPTPEGDLDDVEGLSLQEKIDRQVILNEIERPTGYTVSYHFNPEVEGHHFGKLHPMKPWRLTLTKQLVMSYGLHFAMDNYVSLKATKEDMAVFHDRDYLEFLSKITPENITTYDAEVHKRFNIGEDCPVFDGLWDYCSLYSGATIDAVRKLTNSQSDIAINWTGGLHHAKKGQASGFCYVNDIVLAIIELLRFHQRVLYIDIDVHHGDGVEQAFQSTNRVMTVSFHKYEPEGFFPGTGAADETGPDNAGKHHSLNVPLKDGIDDQQYVYLFDAIIGRVVASFRPAAIVLQCGADSLGGDRLGKFNLNIKAHGHCVEFVKRYGLPLLILGGGGYTARNVARLWCHETAICVGAKLNEQLPQHIPYRQRFEGAKNGNGKMYPVLDTGITRHENEHDPTYLGSLIQNVAENLKYLEFAPSVQMNRIPPGLSDLNEQLDREVAEELEAEEKERKRKEVNLGGRGEHRF